MWLIGSTIILFSIIKTKALECVSVINRKCMPRPKILDVNEGVGEALFYPYNVLVNKCSGSCDAINNPMAKLGVPGIVKRVNMQVYNFLMRLNETRSVLWHENCKGVCKLDSSVCNNKQIWNSDTCKCDCNEECTSIINETMINNVDNNTTTYIFIGLFSVLLFVKTVCFCVFAYFKWFKGKKLFKNKFKNKYADYYNVQYKIMLVKSLKIKNESIFYSNDMIKLNNFDSRLLKINKRENRENNNICYISYKINKPEHNINSINNLCFVIDYLCGTIEKIDGSKDRYLVIDADRLINKENIDLFYYLWNVIISKIKYLRVDDVMFDDSEVIIKDLNKIRFSSDVFIPNDVLINFRS